MATVLNGLAFADLRWMLDHMKEGMVISCYADMSVSNGVLRDGAST